MIYEARLKAQRDDYSRMNGARQKGLQEGIRKGREEGQKEGREKGLQEGREEGREEGELRATRKIILEMGKKGLDIKTITAVTQVSEQQINDILKEKI
ncbi:MAG: hypothetical protein LBK74_11440 [Treponema sp.]|jgi:predicted transposase YdaD|nr:hypothetical protein [Treponema sp.]